MSEKRRSAEAPPDDARPPARRIETQIHRRKKVKAVPPLEAEWDAASGEKPKGLRTPSDRMDRTSS